VLRSFAVVAGILWRWWDSVTPARDGCPIYLQHLRSRERFQKRKRTERRKGEKKAEKERRMNMKMMKVISFV
jgi:hypothetical protein